ncbi:MAG TPA: hypothetical protein VM509_01555 [Planctomycetota bacterium]|nr:hypothetical protein [Planctomycetota bacterium]
MRWRIVRKSLLALTLGVIVALLLGELGIRWILFRDGKSFGELGRTLRRAERYADGNCEDDFWKLNCLLQGEAALEDAPGPHAIMGWTGGGLDPVTYAHPDESAVGDKQLVLLYGDSFAQCNTPPELCFQTILANSDLGQQYAMLNYGIGGYGLDQIYMLIQRSIDRHKDKQPIVIVAILVESDFERSVLEFRGWPKPRLDVVGEKLVERGPVSLSTRDYLAQNPVSIQSYLWRLFLHQTTPFLAAERARWSGASRLTEEKKTLNLRILQEIEHELSSRGLRHFFLLFHAEEGALRRWNEFAWQEQMVVDVCAEHATPLIDTRAFMDFAADGYKEICARFYGRDAPLLGHHNELGNLICFEAMRQGILGRFGAPDMRHLAELKAAGMIELDRSEKTPCTFLGRAAMLITHDGYGAPRAVETAEPHRLLLRAGSTGLTGVKFELAGGAKRFTGELHAMAGAKEGCPELGLSFDVVVDNKIVLHCAPIPPASSPFLIDVDLTGRQALSLVLRGDRGGAGCNWIAVENPRLE